MSDSGFTWGDYVSWRERAKAAERERDAVVARLGEVQAERDQLRGFLDRLCNEPARDQRGAGVRSPDRIDPFLRALGDVWKQHPDMRFGQLVMNLSRVEGGFADTWNWEDGEWYRRMDEYPAAPDSSTGA